MRPRFRESASARTASRTPPITRPDDLVVATKGGYHDSRPQTIAREIEGSRQRLRTDRIDLYYLHTVHDVASIEDSLGAIVRERELSNVDAAQLRRALAVTQIAAVQNHYNLAHREHDDVLDLCVAEGIPFVPYFPLRDVTPAAREIAARHAATPTQVALRWLLYRSPTTLPIPGTLSIKQVRGTSVHSMASSTRTTSPRSGPYTKRPERQKSRVRCEALPASPRRSPVCDAECPENLVIGAG